MSDPTPPQSTTSQTPGTCNTDRLAEEVARLVRGRIFADNPTGRADAAEMAALLNNDLTPCRTPEVDPDERLDAGRPSGARLF